MGQKQIKSQVCHQNHSTNSFYGNVTSFSKLQGMVGSKILAMVTKKCKEYFCELTK